eukprot:766994-Hanusia_phi.AAC.1
MAYDDTTPGRVPYRIGWCTSDSIVKFTHRYSQPRNLQLSFLKIDDSAACRQTTSTLPHDSQIVTLPAVLAPSQPCESPGRGSRQAGGRRSASR